MESKDIAKVENINAKNNQVIGFLGDITVVKDKDGKLFYYIYPGEQDNMIGTSVEPEILCPISELSEKLQGIIFQHFADEIEEEKL